MRWVFDRGPGVCATCGADLERAAVWCGSCGARVGDGEAAEAVDDAATHSDTTLEGEAEVVESAGSVLGRRVTAALLVGLLAFAVVAVAVRPEPVEPLLGRVGTQTGVTASGLPPAGLGVAWEHTPRGFGGEDVWYDHGGGLVVGDDRARVAGTVVDLTTGQAVGLSTQTWGVGGRTYAQVVGDQLVVIDALTGAVTSRATLDVDPSMPWWTNQRSGEVNLLANEVGSLLVRDDGTVIADLPGWGIQGYGDDARDEPAAFALRGATGEDLYYGELGPGGPPLRLVSVADGRTVLEREPGGDLLLADVAGDRALVLRTGLDTVGVPGEGAEWRVELVDATDGALLSEFSVLSAEVPRLLGTTSDGDAVVGGRSGRTLSAWQVTDDGLRTITVGEASNATNDGYYAPDGAALRLMALTDDDLVVVVDGDEVVARSLAGRAVWRVDASPETMINTDGGVVAVMPGPNVPRGPQRTVRLLAAEDGRRLAAVPSVSAAWLEGWRPQPTVAIEGHVGMGEPTGAYWGMAGGLHLGTSTWIDLRTGATAPFDEVLGPLLGDDTSVSSGWRLHGVVVDDETGATSPVLTTDQGRAALHVLEEDGVAVHDLPVPDADDPAGHVTEHVAADADRVVLTGITWREHGGEEEATYVLDRASGEVQTFPDITGFALVGDLLLALAVDRMTWLDPEVVAIDLPTGRERWRTPLIGDVYGGRVLHDAEVLLLGDGLTVTAIDLADGTASWRHDATSELLPFRVLGRSSVLLATTGGHVLALDRATGAERWRRDVGSPVMSLSGAGDGVVVGTLAGDVVVLDAAGHEVQRVGLAAPVERAMALGDTVLGIEAGGRIVGLRADGSGITRSDEVDLP